MEQSSTRRKSRGGILIAALALILLVGVIVGGYFLAKRQGWLPGAEVETELLRLLAYVPDKRHYREGGVWFGDMGQLMANHALPPVRDVDDYEDLSEKDRDLWMQASRNVWTSDRFSGVQYTLSGRWRDLFGYDWFQVDREISAGQPPEWFAVMEGGFDTDDIEDALADLDYDDDEYEGTTYYRSRDDYETDLESEGSRVALSNLNRIVVGESRLVAAPATEILEDVLDAQAGRRDSLAENPTYAALARAMGPVVGAALLDEEEFEGLSLSLRQQLSPEMQARLEELMADQYSEPLHRYELVGLGYLDDSDDAFIVIALVYDDAQDAEDDSPLLADRLEEAPSFSMPGLNLSDYWDVEEPEIHPFKGGAVLTTKLELDSDAPPGLWLRMIYTRDMPFLVIGED
jgi:hypothetical protein